MNTMTKSTVTPAARCHKGTDLDVWVARHLAGTRSIPEEAAFFLLVRHYVKEAERRFDASPELEQIMDGMERIRIRYGLDPQFQNWQPGMEPPETIALEEAHDALYRSTYVAVFLEHGEKGLAELYRNDHAEFERRYKAGWAYFHGPMAPEDGEQSDRRTPRAPITD